MTKALLVAANSQFIDPAFMKKLVAMKDNLDAVAVAVKMYRQQNVEHGTAHFKLHACLQVSEARKWFTYFDKILAVERPELSLRNNKCRLNFTTTDNVEFVVSALLLMY